MEYWVGKIHVASIQVLELFVDWTRPCPSCKYIDLYGLPWQLTMIFIVSGSQHMAAFKDNIVRLDQVTPSFDQTVRVETTSMKPGFELNTAANRCLIWSLVSSLLSSSNILRNDMFVQKTKNCGVVKRKPCRSNGGWRWQDWLISSQQKVARRLLCQIIIPYRTVRKFNMMSRYDSFVLVKPSSLTVATQVFLTRLVSPILDDSGRWRNFEDLSSHGRERSR
jgi:hypothetical protein